MSFYILHLPSATFMYIAYDFYHMTGEFIEHTSKGYKNKLIKSESYSGICTEFQKLKNSIVCHNCVYTVGLDKQPIIEHFEIVEVNDNEI